MLNTKQVGTLALLSLWLWAAATLYIRFLPSAITDPMQGAVGFATTLPAAWLSVWLARYFGRLKADQMMAGIAVVGAVAMMIDGVALHWLPSVYGADETTLRLGAAWLLWGYGVSLAVALAMAEQMRRRAT